MKRKRKTRKGVGRDRGAEGRGSSRYARKKAWLHAHPVRGENGGILYWLWGFDVPAPKPWK